MSQTFGDLLKQLRKRGGMTQLDLAAATGYSRSLIGALERNDRLPDIELVVHSYVPALGLQDEPRLAAQLVELAAHARGERPPTSLTLTLKRHTVITTEEVAELSPLPLPPTELVGRDQIINHLCSRIQGHQGRLLTLVGPPGVGKTSLALALGTELQGVYQDGACFVSLAAVSEPALVASSLATALQIPDSSSKPAQTRLITHLRRKELLLILDNFEQIITAAPVVAQLLTECAGLRVLVTSRERLHLRAEQRFNVTPLDLAPAVELFVQRAQAVDIDFQHTADNHATLEAICQQLDCLPLAVELCAAQVDLLSLTQILNQLHTHRLDLLTDGATDLPPRQRTLRAAIEHSYALLNDTERLLLRTLGVFVNGFTLEGAESLMADRLEAPIRASLHILIGKSLVHAQVASTGEQRFLLLETVREFVLGQMNSDERMRAQQRHTAYFVAHEFTDLDALVRDHANFRAALVWAIDLQDSPSALDLCVKLCWFWETHGYQREGLSLAYAALALSVPVDLDLRIDVLERVSTLAWQGYQLANARQFAEEAVALARRHDRPAKLALALNVLGRILIEQMEYEAAEAALHEGTQLARQAVNLFNPGCPLTMLSEIALTRGAWEAAQAYLAEAIPYLVQAPKGNYVGVFVGMAFTTSAEIALACGNPQQARHELQQAFPQAHIHIRRLRCLLVSLAGILLHPRTLTKDVTAAAELLGAVAGLGKRSCDPLSPLYQKLIDQRSDSAQQLLTECQWQAAWQVGCSWTMAEVIAHVETWLARGFEG